MYIVHNKTAKLLHLALDVFRAGRDYLESSGKTAVLTSLTNIEKKNTKKNPFKRLGGCCSRDLKVEKCIRRI